MTPYACAHLLAHQTSDPAATLRQMRQDARDLARRIILCRNMGRAEYHGHVDTAEGLEQRYTLSIGSLSAASIMRHAWYLAYQQAFERRRAEFWDGTWGKIWDLVQDFKTGGLEA